MVVKNNPIHKIEIIQYNKAKENIKYSMSFLNGFYLGTFGMGIIMTILSIRIENPRILLGTSLIVFGILYWIGEKIYLYKNKKHNKKW